MCLRKKERIKKSEKVDLKNIEVIEVRIKLSSVVK